MASCGDALPCCLSTSRLLLSFGAELSDALAYETEHERTVNARTWPSGRNSTEVTQFSNLDNEGSL